MDVLKLTEELTDALNTRASKIRTDQNLYKQGYLIIVLMDLMMTHPEIVGKIQAHIKFLRETS